MRDLTETLHVGTNRVAEDHKGSGVSDEPTTCLFEFPDLHSRTCKIDPTSPGLLTQGTPHPVLVPRLRSPLRPLPVTDPSTKTRERERGLPVASLTPF